MILSILIPSTIDRHDLLSKLLDELYKQINENDAHDNVEILTSIDNKEKTTGTKRNELYAMAIGLWSVSIDSDDWVYPYYIKEMLIASESNCDCFGVNGIMTTNGGNEKKWYISKDNPYFASVDQQGREIYLRYPNHITAIRSSICKQFKFPDICQGEDYNWATQIHNSGLIKTEHIISKPMYHYIFKTHK